MLKFIHTEDGDKLVTSQETECTIANFAKLYSTYSARDIVDILYSSGFSISIGTGYLFVNNHYKDSKEVVWASLKALSEKVVKAQLLIQLMEQYDE
jgi:hypothetical protein